MGAASSSPAVSPAAGRASKSHTFLEEVSAGGEKSASLKRAKSSRINNFGKRNSEPMADYDDEFAEAHAEFLRETMARRNSDVDVGEGRRFIPVRPPAHLEHLPRGPGTPQGRPGAGVRRASCRP